jgi:hypothetical protein
MQVGLFGQPLLEEKQAPCHPTRQGNAAAFYSEGTG